jgi:hypothetical protein
MVRYSFLVRLSHPLLHAGLSRRLPDYLVRPHQHVRRYRQADLFRRLQIDDELERLWLLHGEISRFSASQNLVHIRSSAPEQVGSVRAIVHEAAGFHIVCLWINRREPVLSRAACT